MAVWPGLRKWQETLEEMSEHQEIDESTYVLQMNNARSWHERLSMAAHRRGVCRMKRTLLVYFEEFRKSVEAFNALSLMNARRLEWKQYHAEETDRIQRVEEELVHDERIQQLLDLRPTAAALVWGYLMRDTAYVFWIAPLWLTTLWAPELWVIVKVPMQLCVCLLFAVVILAMWTAAKLGDLARWARSAIRRR